MILRLAGVILLLHISAAPCGAQLFEVIQEQLVTDGDVVDVFSIAEVTFVLREREMLDTTMKETDLALLISPTVAVKKGLPNRLTSDFIDRLLEGHQEPHLREATVINFGDDGFFWKIRWALFSSPGGLSGVPYEYHALVRPDGTSVRPELYLCDACDSYTADPGRALYSVLAFDDLLPVTKSAVTEDAIRKAAAKAFNTATAKLARHPEFRMLAPRRQVFPGKLTSKHDTSSEVEVWAVRFVDPGIENPEDRKYVGSIIVWVTSDLITSELTIGAWEADSKRGKPGELDPFGQAVEPIENPFEEKLSR